MNQTTSVLIADDHAMVRQGLARIIDSEPGLRVAAQAIDGHSTLQALEQTPADVLLLDLTMPAPSGVELVRTIRERHPGQRILVLSMHNNPRIARAAIEAGANGYLTKDSDPDVLLHAVRLVARGGHYMDPGLMEAILFAPATTPPERLSPREQEVLRRLAAGQSNIDIARALYLSEKTVSTHRARLRAKLGLNSLADLLRYAQEHLPATD
ncbi:MAG: response regulator [Hydrogenophaga sp.]